MIHLKTQAELLADMESRLRDSSNARNSETELKTAINDAVAQWANRVSVPVLYDPAATWGDDTYSTTLPSYIDPSSITVQFRSDSTSPWANMLRYETYPDASGGYTLQLPVNANVEWRIIHWAENGQLPTATITLSGTIADDDTSLTITGTNDIAEVGFIKLDAEWIQYSGVVYGVTTTTLQNLVRSFANTQAATHTSGITVHFGVAATEMSLFRNLLDQALAFAHETTLGLASSLDRDYHMQMVSYYQSRAESYWRRHIPSRAPQVIPYLSTLTRTYTEIADTETG